MICGLKRGTLFLIVVFLVAFFAWPGIGKEAPRYIFLFIGDGMGSQEVQAGRWWSQSSEGGKKDFHMVQFPVSSLVSTGSYQSELTDSAAAATALATGVKTVIGTIAMDYTRTKKLKTIAEEALGKDRKVGIITTNPINDATPAGFYAHQPSRQRYYEIARDLVGSGFDFFAGSGMADPRGKKGNEPDIFGVAREKGYQVVRDRTRFDQLQPGSGKVLAILPISFAIDRKAGEFTLAEIVQTGIRFLEGREGFFLMVEGGRIDWAGHVNDAATSVREVQGFDQAVEVAASFYQKHSTETLVIVTADHETGGMSVDQNAFRPDLLSGQAVSYERFILILKSFEKNHSSSPVPWDQLRTLIEKNFGTLIMAEVEKEQNAIEKSYTRSWQGEKSGGYDPFLVFLLHLRDEQAGIAWTTHGHSTVKVPVYALGVDADLFAGVQDNTDIFRVIRKIIAGGGETVEATNK